MNRFGRRFLPQLMQKTKKLVLVDEVARDARATGGFGQNAPVLPRGRGRQALLHAQEEGPRGQAHGNAAPVPRRRVQLTSRPDTCGRADLGAPCAVFSGRQILAAACDAEETIQPPPDPAGGARVVRGCGGSSNRSPTCVVGRRCPRRRPAGMAASGAGARG